MKKNITDEEILLQDYNDKLGRLKITPDTLIYFFGCDRKDPIHFSATTGDMRIISH